MKDIYESFKTLRNDKMFQLKRGMPPGLIKELILLNRQYRYDLQNNPDLAVPIVKSVHKGLKSLS